MENTPKTKREFDMLVQIFSRAREYRIPAEEIIEAMKKCEAENETTQDCLSQSSSLPRDLTYIEHE